MNDFELNTAFSKLSTCLNKCAATYVFQAVTEKVFDAAPSCCNGLTHNSLCIQSFRTFVLITNCKNSVHK